MIWHVFCRAVRLIGVSRKGAAEAALLGVKNSIVKSKMQKKKVVLKKAVLHCSKNAQNISTVLLLYFQHIIV